MARIEVAYDEILRKTDAARLVRFDTEEHWIPRSQSEVLDTDHIEIEKWLVTRIGLEEYQVE